MLAKVSWQICCYKVEMYACLKFGGGAKVLYNHVALIYQIYKTFPLP